MHGKRPLFIYTQRDSLSGLASVRTWKCCWINNETKSFACLNLSPSKRLHLLLLSNDDLRSDAAINLWAPLVASSPCAWEKLCQTRLFDGACHWNPSPQHPRRRQRPGRSGTPDMVLTTYAGKYRFEEELANGGCGE